MFHIGFPCVVVFRVSGENAVNSCDPDISGWFNVGENDLLTGLADFSNENGAGIRCGIFPVSVECIIRIFSFFERSRAHKFFGIGPETFVGFLCAHVGNEISAPPFGYISLIGPVERWRNVICIVDGVLQHSRGKTFESVCAADLECLVSCRVQCRQKHGGEDCDDRNYHEEFYKGETVGFSLQR